MQPFIQPVTTRRDLKKFIFVPEMIHETHENWVPPIYADEWKFYDPKHNKALHDAEVILLLAYEDAHPVGRIMGIINRKNKRLHDDATASFF